MEIKTFFINNIISGGKYFLECEIRDLLSLDKEEIQAAIKEMLGDNVSVLPILEIID